MCSRFLEFFQRCTSSKSVVSICEVVSCNCIVNKGGGMAQAQVDLNKLNQEGETNYQQPPIKKTKKSTKKGVGCRSVSRVIEIRRSFQGEIPKPKVVLEDGWVLYLADEEGTNKTMNYINIRNENGQGISLPLGMGSCLLQGLVELQK